jgi:crossover junction endodeoxyribonuclease RuvC
MAYLGIDPGKSGAIAMVDKHGMTMDWIGLHETQSDIWKFVKLYARAIDWAIVEKVGARPGNGLSSTWKFAQSYGAALAMLIAADIPHEQHSPVKWQRRMGLIRPKLTNAEKKKVNKAKAQEVFRNSINIIHRNADAFLIAEYARRIHLGVHE